MDEKTLVLIGFAEALSAPEVAWSLLDSGWTVKAFARRGRHAALKKSRYVEIHEITPPETDAVRAKEELAELLGSFCNGAFDHHVLFPLDDASVLLGLGVSEHQGWKLAGATGSGTGLALDKCRQVQAAKSAGFLVPESFVASTVADLSKSSLSLPLILRHASAALVIDGKLKKGKNWICSDQNELDSALAIWKEQGPLLVQPFIQGKGEGIFGLATAQGVCAWSAHKRLRMMNPHGSGSSACVSQPVSEEAKLATERLIRQNLWRGLFMVELLRDFSGRLWFVEFNGRPWGSMALSRRVGLEYPSWAVSSALDPDWQPTLKSPPKNPVECRNAGRELMHLLFVLRGPKSKALEQWPSFWRTLFEMLKVRPDTSLYNWHRGDLMVFFSDSWNTLRANLFKSRKGNLAG